MITRWIVKQLFPEFGKAMHEKEKINSKLPHVGTTIFTVMSKLATENQAINLAQGFPNFPIDENLVRYLHESIDSDCHQYMPMPGFTPLLLAIAEKIRQSYQRAVDPQTELLVSAGATQGIFTSIQALVQPNDEVVILDPAYDCYDPAVVLAGGIPIHVPLQDNYRVDWNAIDAAVTSKTRLLIINNPHNPSGTVWENTDFEGLAQIMLKNPKVLLLSDEVYEYITFDKPHRSLNHYPELFERSILVSSFGKTFHITGWKIGYLLAPAYIMSEIKKVHQFNVFCVNSPAQFALSKYLNEVNHLSLGSFYKAKRDLFRSLLEKSRFKLLPCEGTYFQVADFSDISDKDDVTFCKWLTEEHGVAAIPLSVFNEDKSDRKHIRFCFAKDDSTLIQASEKLCKI